MISGSVPEPMQWFALENNPRFLEQFLMIQRSRPTFQQQTPSVKANTAESQLNPSKPPLKTK